VTEGNRHYDTILLLFTSQWERLKNFFHFCVSILTIHTEEYRRKDMLKYSLCFLYLSREMGRKVKII
jgi:hypothetical protein